MTLAEPGDTRTPQEFPGDLSAQEQNCIENRENDWSWVEQKGRQVRQGQNCPGRIGMGESSRAIQRVGVKRRRC